MFNSIRGQRSNMYNTIYSTKYVKIIFFSIITLGLVYNTCRVYPRISTNDQNTIIIHKNHFQHYNEAADYLINTPGCIIPNYIKTYKIIETQPLNKTCGERAVFVKKISNDIIKFNIDDKVMRYNSKGKQYKCCYKFVIPFISSGKVDYRVLRYSQCKDFTNETEAFLEHEIIVVTCSILKKTSTIYEDAYVILKKITVKKDERDNKKSWNVLMFGMDTMSRARTYESMPKTAAYLSKNNWLDYRGYQKVGYNTFPNVLVLLTGKNISEVYAACSSGMDRCNELLIWSDFQKAGYVTATGEENLRLPDTFGKYGYQSSPTNHYLRPLFLTGEHGSGNVVCTKKMPSAKHMLDYALQFTNVYKENNYFGFFWSNSYSHNTDNTPTLIDKDIVDFFTTLNETGILNDTFIFFLSDHGSRYGNMRVPYESYYDERLPMLFLWVPYSFRKSHFNEYNNFILNQNRLVTPYDMYLTLQDILLTSTKSEQYNKPSTNACPNCMSLFNEIDPQRKCNDVNVSDKWCTCHDMRNLPASDEDMRRSIELCVTQLQKKIKETPTTSCMKCIELKLKNILRAHVYRDESSNSTYFIIAFVMTPGEVAFEATVVKRDNEFSVVEPTYSITSYNARGSCVVIPYHRQHCVCMKIKNCKNKQ